MAREWGSEMLLTHGGSVVSEITRIGICKWNRDGEAQGDGRDFHRCVVELGIFVIDGFGKIVWD